MVMSRQQNAGQNHNSLIDNKSFEKCGKDQMFWNNSSCINEEMKIRLIPGNACYHPVQNIFSSCLLSKNFKIKIYETVILHTDTGVKLGL
jgi:hypothetical protein